jgi:hypothetical protein
VTATTSVRISATFNGATANADMTLFPLLSSVSFPGNVPGGSPAIGTVTLSAAAPSGGLVVALSSGNTSLVTVPASITVPAGQTSANFTANTQPVTQTTSVVISASSGGTTVTTTMFLVVSTAVASVTLNPSTVVGPASSTGTVTLRSAATGDAVVELASSNTTLATVPFSVVVPSGQTSTTFTVNAAQVTSASTVVISATRENVTQSATLTINPQGSTAPAAPTLVSPANAATNVAQPVTLDWNDVTDAASYEVQVDDTSTIATPFVANPTVTASQATLSGLPAQQLWWRVRARNSAGVFGPFSATRTFTPQSSTPPTGTSTLTVTATGRSGERVTSSPAGINVPVGSTGSAVFNNGTSITLSVTNGRDAIWSGACSSGGNKTKTCTFTLNANSSVTANVQ